jgi:hypothetical protein
VSKTGLPRGQASVTFSIRGSGFVSPVAVTVDGNVSVTSAVVVPSSGGTQIDVTASTVNAAVGTRTITVVNPDSLSASAALLSVRSVAPNDYDGDFIADLAFYRPTVPEWKVRTSTSGFTSAVTRTIGAPGLTAVPGDYDGDGRIDYGIYVETTGAWQIYSLSDGRRFSTSGRFAQSQTGKVREDTRLGAVITDPERGTVTLLIPGRQEAHVFTFPPEQGASRLEQRQGRGKTEPGTVQEGEPGLHEGRQVRKMKSRDAKGRNREMWVAPDVPVPVFIKSESDTMSTQRMLRRIVVQEPEPSLFEVPGGYKTVRHDTRWLGQLSGDNMAVPPALFAPPAVK